MRCRQFRAFGLEVESSFDLPGRVALGAEPSARVYIEMASPGELARCWSGACGPPDWKTVLGDGIALQHESGIAGDQRFSYGRDTFVITTGARTVLCAVEDPDDARWQRQLLDTILFSVSLANGFELLHASAVEVDEGIVAFVAPSGGGKSSIAAELRRRGYRIVCDDVLAIGWSDDEVVGYPGPAVMSVPGAAGDEDEPGVTLVARFAEEDERWVVLDDVATSPGAVRAVYLIDRAANSRCVSSIDAPTLLDLLPHAISLPNDAERLRKRFELFSTLAGQIELFRLAAGLAAGPSTLADLVEMSFARAGSRPAVG